MAEDQEPLAGSAPQEIDEGLAAQESQDDQDPGAWEVVDDGLEAMIAEHREIEELPRGDLAAKLAERAWHQHQADDTYGAALAAEAAKRFRADSFDTFDQPPAGEPSVEVSPRRDPLVAVLPTAEVVLQILVAVDGGVPQVATVVVQDPIGLSEQLISAWPVQWTTMSIELARRTRNGWTPGVDGAGRPIWLRVREVGGVSEPERETMPMPVARLVWPSRFGAHEYTAGHDG